MGPNRLSTLRELEMELIAPRLLEVLRRQGLASLTPFQVDTLTNGIMRLQSQVLVTFDFDEAYDIAEIAILNRVASDPRARVMVICPSPHLAERRFHSISVKCKRLGVEAVLISRRRVAIQQRIKSGRVIVGTYQSLNIAILNHPELIQDVEAVLIERLDLIGQSEIGAKLESIIVTLMAYAADVQYIAITPPIDNMDDVRTWLDAVAVEDHKPEVRRIFSVKVYRSTNESLSTLSNFVVKGRGQVMVLCPSNKDAEEMALRLGGELDGGEEIELEMTSMQLEDLRTLAGDIEHIYPECDVTVKLSSIIPKGVAFFHNGLSRNQRRKISRAWEEGVLPVITMPIQFSIASGMRATVVFLMGVYKQNIEAQDEGDMEMMTEWELSDVLLAAGRAGRDREAFGIVVVDSDEERKRVLAKYFVVDEEGNIAPHLGEIDSTMDDPDNAQALVLRQICAGLQDGDPFQIIDKTFWAAEKRMTNIGREEILNVSAASVNALIMLRSTKTTLERAKKIPDKNIKIISITPQKIEGLVKSSTRDLWHHVVYKLDEGVSCTCESWKFQGARRHRLCKHLVKMAMYALNDEEARPYASTIIVQALRGLEILGELQREGLIVREQERTRCTEMGKSVVLLGVSLKDAKRIKHGISKQRGLKDILQDVIATKMGVSKGAVKQVLDGLPAESLSDIVRASRGQPGLIENIIEEAHYINWVLLRLMAGMDRTGINREAFELNKSLNEILAAIG